jgi:hypothetical protein
VGPQAGNVDSWSLEKVDRLSSWLPDVDVAGAHDISWGGPHLTSLCLAAKLSHVRADVWASAALDCLFRGYEAPRMGHQTWC